RNIELALEEDSMDFDEDEQEDKEEILKLIESENVNILNEKQLEEFIEFCLQITCLIKDEIQEEFEEDDDYYYVRFKQAEMVLNKACNAAVRVNKIKKNIKPYCSVIYMMAEMCMEAHDFEGALQLYENINYHYPNYNPYIKCKIFNIKYYTNDGAGEYIESLEKENNAMWEYNRALFNYSNNNEVMAIKYLKEALRKNKMIYDILLDNIHINPHVDLSPLEKEAFEYYMCSKWIWVQTNEALEWMFYKKQELRKQFTSKKKV
ncbi:MAG: hypothetical protein RSG52_14795, partial [Terrisporobacter sp.]|uniref:hypothetical protein n=1 Tax=Terrisporobacter sp. TaxID=1965305 RepID=UPI002FC9E240